jgi:chromate transporter
MNATSDDAPRPSSPTELFLTFTWLALQGFGGVLAITQRVLCENKRWLTREQFVEILAIAQVLPGPNVVNVSLMLGDRFFGWRGAFAALGGMLALPMVLVLLLTALYAEYAHIAEVAGALRGMGAVAAGMIVGTALRLVSSLRGNPLGPIATTTLAVAAFIAVALLRWPLVWVLVGLGIIGCTLAWRHLRRIVQPAGAATGSHSDSGSGR